MCSTEQKKIVVQCDFDGTVTEEDVSFLILDAFADKSWRELLEEYRRGKISVGAFNTGAFAMVKADEATLCDFVSRSSKVKVRRGFRELLIYCSGKGFKFVVVSNGLDFYIEAILKDIGVRDVEVFAARSRFSSEGMEVKYMAPDGRQLDDSFKQAYTELFLGKGYHVVYIGNGVSDIYPARRAQHVFATGDLLDCCRKTNLHCIPFNDFNDVVRGLRLSLPG